MKLTCHIPSTSEIYDIEIGHGILPTQMAYIQTLAPRIALISDDRVAPLYAHLLHGLEVHLFSFPAGEQHKTRATKERLENQLFERGLGRDTCVVALGGGVVTDLAGYLAATYCRGLPLVMIPTSLLAMVDASIGGKTGVNVPYGKNMVGCFYQPKRVIIDLFMLRSLPKKELIHGVVEMIKHGLIANPTLFETLENNSSRLLALDPSLLEQTIFESCRIKKEIIEQDEREQGGRALLNFGHTIGHALEQLSDYALSHGEAVAIGLLVESYLAVKLGVLDPTSWERIKTILERYALPLRLPARYPIQTLLDAMVLDKKSVRGEPRFVVLEQIGCARQCLPVEKALLKNALQWMNDALCCD